MLFQANSLHINPLYLMIPVTVSASFSYILPVSTPPNAIVYAYGDITMLDIVSVVVFSWLLAVIIPNSVVSGWLTTTLLQCFDTVGWVIRPVKTVGRITYIVLAQT